MSIPEQNIAVSADRAWRTLKNTPINDDGEIIIPFLHFPAGTQREAIWNWMEQTFPGFSVAARLGCTDMSETPAAVEYRTCGDCCHVYEVSPSGDTETCVNEACPSHLLPMDADLLDARYNPDGDGEHPIYTRYQWREAVSVEETLLGYWEWVEYQLKAPVTDAPM